jgi:hypothetical protein
MNIGILFFDQNVGTTLEVKIQKAVEAHRKKFGEPEICLVDPALMPRDTKQFQIGKLIVRAHKPIPNGHVWIGIEIEDIEILNAQLT